MNLLPGMQFPDIRTESVNTFIARCNHPYYEGLQLVIWRVPANESDTDGSLSLDALSPMQDVGEPMESTPSERRENLHRALHSEERSK